MDEARAKGPLLLVDSGNALFKAPGLADDAAKLRAELILDTMGRLGTFAMAVGTRDLVAGREFLDTRAQRAGVKLLSVNLRGEGDKSAYPGSAVTTVDGVKVGLIGASPPGPLLAPAPEKLIGAPLLKAVLDEAARLRKAKVDFVLVLAAVPYADALQLAQESKGAVDLVLQANEGRGMGMLQGVGAGWVVPSGERGKAIGRLDISLSGRGPFIDLGEVDRSRQTAEILASQLAEVDRRLTAATDPAVKKSLQDTRASFLARKKEVDRAIAAAAPGKGRTLKLEWRHLTEDVKADPELKARVDKIEPSGSVH